MYKYRISKYNKNRSSYDNDWTDVNQIGKKIGEDFLSVNTFCNMEDKYIQSLLLISHYYLINEFKISSLEKRKDYLYRDFIFNYDEKFLFIYKSIKNDIYFRLSDVRYIVKLILRNELWCILVNGDNLKIEFGYDFYMYVYSEKELAQSLLYEINKLGLDFDSNYYYCQ